MTLGGPTRSSSLGRLLAVLAAIVLTAPLATSAVPLAPEPNVPPLEATIVRDEFGVAHIYADSEEALWTANGYVMAQDRLWGMDLLRHIAYGEGASVVGPGGGILAMDLQTRRDLYNRSQLETMMADAPQEFVEIVTWYTNGVNRAAVEMQASGDVPAEFPALQHTFEEWKPIDTVAVATYLLAVFGEGGGSEMGNAKLLAQLEAELGDGSLRNGASNATMAALEDLVWVERDDAYATIKGATYGSDPQGDAATTWSDVPADQREASLAAAEAESFGLGTQEVARLEALGGFLADEEVDLRWGSNALVIGPGLSSTGKAMVGGGPQTGYFNPQILYEVGLHGPKTNATGIGVMGAPAVIIGRTASFAWTVTSGISDQTDMIALEAAGPRSYVWPTADGEEVRGLDCRTERHEIFVPPATGGPDVQAVDQEVCLAHLPTPDGFGGTVTRSAPIQEVTRDAEGNVTWFFAKRTSSRSLEVLSAVKWLSLDHQTDFDGFESRFEPDANQGLPGFAFTFNFHYAGLDGDGNEVGCYKHVGLQPLRDASLDPRFPTPAGDAHVWTGYLTGAELPNACEYGAGYFANWNNLPQTGWESGDSRELWGSIHRVERLDAELQQVLAEKNATDATPLGDETLSLEDVKLVLKRAATEDSLAGQIVPALLDPALDPGTAPAAAEALEAWGGLDYPWRSGDSKVNATVSNDTGEVYVDEGHTVYDTLLPVLLDRVLGDELGDHARGVTFGPEDGASDPHAGDHGQHRNVFAILVDALEGTTTTAWCDDVRTAPVESCGDQLMLAYAASGLDRYGSVEEIPLTEQHRSPFTSLGLGPAYTMPMTNRASYYHFHVGSDTSTSQGLVPAGVSGHVDAAHALLILGGRSDGPEHMHDQLEPYVTFDPKDLWWSEADARAHAESVETFIVP